MRTLAVIVVALIGPMSLRGGEVASTSTAPVGDVLRTLRANHPRLYVLDDDVARVKRATATDATAKAWFEQLRTAGDKIIAAPVAQRVLLGPRLLRVSRAVLVRVTTLAGLYRITGETKYAERARDELLAVAKFSDWHPPHFLDVAEMTNASAIGYDWLFDFLTTDERAAIQSAIVEKGLKPGLTVYASGKGFAVNTNNWNQVCNGGLTAGALAVAEDEPDVARQVIEKARASIPRAMALFAPDGGCEEGPGYWAYATDYTSYYLCALHTALGTDLGFLDTPGLAQTGLFRIYSIGPIGKPFNFADAGEAVTAAPQMFFFARTFNRPVYAYHERQRMTTPSPSGLTMFHLMWFNPAGGEADLKALPLAAMFKRVNVAFLRSAWDDKDAAFVGFKGGNNTFSHGHLDLGTFVYDVDGVRWAYDLGGDDYNLPGYFGAQRWDYYRLRTEGHNTLLIDGQNQNAKAKAPIVAFSAERREAVADLSAAYPMAKHVGRGVRLIGKQLLVQDEVESDKAVEVVWNFHTPAKIEVRGAEATLSQSGKTLMAKILSPAEAKFEMAPADPEPKVKANPPQGRHPSENSKKLIVTLPGKVTQLRLVVVLTPQGENGAAPTLQWLHEWSAAIHSGLVPEFNQPPTFKLRQPTTRPSGPLSP